MSWPISNQALPLQGPRTISVFHAKASRKDLWASVGDYEAERQAMPSRSLRILYRTAWTTCKSHCRVLHVVRQQGHD